MPFMTYQDVHAKTLSNLTMEMELREAQAKAEAAAETAKRTREMQNFLQQYGPDIAQGDPIGLAELAKRDPKAAQEFAGKATENAKASFTFDQEQHKAAQAEADDILKSLTAVQAAPPEARGIMYRRQLRELARSGHDTTGVPQEYDENWVKTKAQEMMSVSERLSAMQADPEYIARKTAAENENKPKPIQGIVTMVSPDGNTTRSFRTGAPELDQAIKDGWTERSNRTGQGLRITTPDGTEITQGDIGGGLRPTTVNALEGTRIADSNRLYQVNRIRNSFDPKFLQVGTRAGMAWSSLKARFSELSADDQKNLEDFAVFKADTTEYFNTTIRALTGSALSPGEAARVAATQPTAGEGIFDGDDPVTFKAKMERSLETIQAAIIRENIWRSTGMQGKPWEAMPLTNVRDWVNKRGQALKQEIKKANPGMDAAAVDAEMRARLRREIGSTE